MSDSFMDRLNQAVGSTTASSSPVPEEPVVVKLADVQPEPVRWLWQYWLAEGTVAVLDGDPGLGKSTFTLDLAARITLGRVMPPGDERDRGRQPAGVLLLGAEDSLKHTVRPRLDAAGADPDRVFSLEGVRQGESDRPAMLPYDLELMASRIREWGVKLVVVDPLMAFLGAEYDAHKDQDVRRCLRPLGKLAEELDIVVLLLRHLNKLSGGAALYRGGSSIAITGTARTSLIVGRDPEADRFILAMNKTNLGPKPTSLAYRIESAGMGSRIVWDGEAELSPDDILGHGAGSARPDADVQAAMKFLTEMLADGPILTKDLQRQAKDAGHAWRTVERAKAAIKANARREGRIWFWELPGSSAAANCVPGDETEMEEDGDGDDPRQDVFVW